MVRDSAVVPPEATADSRASAGEDVAEPGLRARAGREAARVRSGMRHPHNWFQLVRFSIVGATGYVINLLVYSTLVYVFDVQYLVAAALAFCVAVTNNFLLNRHWTFRAGGGRMTFQAPRFVIVSVLALGVNLVVLELLVGAFGVHKIAGQAAAILAATPFNFVGNKLWSFSRFGPGHGGAPEARA
jgi:putative flippase GtrA